MSTKYDVDHYDKYDSSFVDDLKQSYDSVWIAARWLSENGYNVTVRPLKVRPTTEEMSEYSDSGDLEIIQRIEVKRRPHLQFTCKEDYPYKTAIVDVAHTWDNANPKPYAYIILNADATYCLVVKGDSFKNWTRAIKLDRAKNRERTFYECPIELCTFHRVSKYQEDV